MCSLFSFSFFFITLLIFLALQFHPPGMELPPPAVEVGSLNQWTAREVPDLVLHQQSRQTPLLTASNRTTVGLK